MILELLFAAVVPSLLTALGFQRLEVRTRTRERDAARAAEREAGERLLAARKDGFEIPHTSPLSEYASVLRDPAADLALIPELLEAVNDWEEAGAQKAALAYVKQRLANGASQTEILREMTPVPQS